MENPDDALVCKHCGADLNESDKFKFYHIRIRKFNLETMALCVTIANFVLPLFTVVFHTIFHIYYYDWVRWLIFIISLASNILILLMSISMKNRTYKIVGIVCSSLVLLWTIIGFFIFNPVLIRYVSEHHGYYGLY